MAKIKPGVVAGLVLATIVAITVIVIIIVLVVRRVRPVSSTETENLNENPALSGILCSSNDQCATGACNTSLGVCVDCLVDDDCGSSLPFCKTENNTCVECLETADCDSPETCVENQCCQDTKPEITGVSSTFGFNRGLEISYDIFQPRSTSKVLLIIEDPATGFVIGRSGCQNFVSPECLSVPGCDEPCIEFPATAPILSLRETNVGFRFYGGFEYRLRMQIEYRCGTSTTQLTEMSDAFDFTMPLCPDTDTIIPTGISTEDIEIVNRSLPPQIIIVQSEPFIQVAVPNSDPNFSATIIAYLTSGLHPSLAPIEFGAQSRDGAFGLKWLDIPRDTNLIPPGTTVYFRVFRNGAIGDCDGNITTFLNEVSWTY